MIFNLNFALILLEAAAFQKISTTKCKDVWKVFVGFSFVQLSLIASLRASTVGIDTPNYLEMFSNAQKGVSTFYIEWGSRLYILLLGQITQDNNIFLAAWAIPTIALFYRYIVKNSKNIYLSVCIYASLMYYFLLFNMVRQALAIGIVLQAVEPLKKKKYIQYILIIFIAMLFHTSAAVFLLMLPINILKVRSNMSIFLLVAILCAVCVCVGKSIILFGAGLIGYEGYLNSGFAGEGNIFHPILFLLLLFVCTLLILCVNKKKAAQYRLEYDMFAVGVLFYWLSIPIQIVNRIPYYFTGSILVLLPNLTEEMKNKNQARLVRIAVLAFLVIYELLMVKRSAQGVTPYKFFFMKGT